ncbi:MAG: tetratricopeptide repeat protein [Gemmatimonadaceae bacterium]
MGRFACATLAAAIVASPALAQHGHGLPGESLGTVSFPTSCGPAVQPRVDRAVAMLHSFWFEEAHKAFSDIAATDTTCAMAHWGIAMTLWGNPFARQPIPGDLQRAGLAAAERAAELAPSAGHRERMYIDAALALWREGDKLDHLARLARHEDAMKKLYEMHPEDQEAALFYGRAMIANAPPTDLEFKRQLQAATMLEPLFEKQPNHPGLAHYIIHTFDSPKLASHGLSAAKRYAAIAPAAPHALHMPSHIFTRLGHWDESITTNHRSASAEPDSNAAVHANDYMVYAYLQQGRDADALNVVARSRPAANRFYGAILGYNAAAMPARYALERSAWREAAALPYDSTSAPFVEAVTRFARAIGAARSANASQASVEVAALAALRDSLKARSDTYWSTIVEAQRLAASAWIAHAGGRNEEAVRQARQGAELEETVEKHPVTPGPLLPARELEGDLLLKLGRPADALRAYEKTLTREPHRARALYGAARAAEKTGNRTVARAHYKELLRLMDRADASRPEVKAAKKFLAR